MKKFAIIMMLLLSVLFLLPIDVWANPRVAVAVAPRAVIGPRAAVAVNLGGGIHGGFGFNHGFNAFGFNRFAFAPAFGFGGYGFNRFAFASAFYPQFSSFAFAPSYGYSVPVQQSFIAQQPAILAAPQCVQPAQYIQQEVAPQAQVQYVQPVQQAVYAQPAPVLVQQAPTCLVAAQPTFAAYQPAFAFSSYSSVAAFATPFLVRNAFVHNGHFRAHGLR